MSGIPLYHGMGWMDANRTFAATHIAFPLAEAEALLGKARDRDEWKASRELQKACADALRAQAEALIDPNDPAVRERIGDAIIYLAARYLDRGEWVPGVVPTKDDYADAVLAALRGAK